MRLFMPLRICWWAVIHDFFQESEKLMDLCSAQFGQISASSSEAEIAEQRDDDSQRLSLLRKTQHELDQIYSTTESIMSQSSSCRVSKSLSSRDSQHLSYGSAEPVLRNSVLISVGEEADDSCKGSAITAETTAEKLNPFLDSSSSEGSEEVTEVKLRRKAQRVIIIHFSGFFRGTSLSKSHATYMTQSFSEWSKATDKIYASQRSRFWPKTSHRISRSPNWPLYSSFCRFNDLQRISVQAVTWQN